MAEQNENTLLNFIIEELKEIKADLVIIKSNMVTKDYCRSTQENCPVKEDLADTQKKTNLNLVR